MRRECAVMSYYYPRIIQRSKAARVTPLELDVLIECYCLDQCLGLYHLSVVI